MYRASIKAPGLFALALTCSAAACSGSQEPQAPPPVATPRKVIEFDGESAWKDMVRTVELGPRHPESPALEQTRMWIEEEARKLGLKPERETFTQKVPVTPNTPKGTIEYANVIVTIEAEVPEGEKPAPILYVAGHIDTKFLGERFISANDGGSSFGSVLELMRGVAASGPRPVTYRFAFFDGEESIRPQWDNPNNTFGSRYHANKIKGNGDLFRTGAFVLLDLVAEKDVKLNWDINSTKWLRDIIWGEAKALGLEKHISRGPGSAISDDHLPFKSLRVPVIDLIDLDYGGVTRPFWHTERDTLDKCSKDSLQVIGNIVCSALPKIEDQVIKTRR
jgi:glutaminyl-peptide cyclotransferase